jgi:hypothetical protein
MPRRTSSRLSARRHLDQAELQQVNLPQPAEPPQVVLPQPAEPPQVVLPQPAELPLVVLPQPAEPPQVVLPQPAELPLVVLPQPAELPLVVLPQPSDMFFNDPFRNRRQNEDKQEKILEMLTAINDSLNRPKSNKFILNQNRSENNQSYSILNFLFQLFKQAVGFISKRKLSIGKHVMVKRSTGDIVKAQITNIYDNEIQVFYYVDKENKIREKIVKKDQIMFPTYISFKFGLLILFVIFFVWIMFFKNQSKNSNYNLLNLNFFNF